MLMYSNDRSYTVVLNGREAIEEALLKRNHDFADRSIMYAEKNYHNTNEKGERVTCDDGTTIQMRKVSEPSPLR